MEKEKEKEEEEGGGGEGEGGREAPEGLELFLAPTEFASRFTTYESESFLQHVLTQTWH